MQKGSVLVTGIAGFIGAHVASALFKSGYKVVGVDNFNKYYDPKLKSQRVKHLLDNSKIKVYKADITDFKQLTKIFSQHKVDFICHLAAQAGVRYSVENPFVYESSNLKGTLNLLELAHKHKVKGFVFASSSSVYGNSKKSSFSETDSTDQPVSLYAATKKSTELLAFAYHKLYGLPCTALRLFTVYGPWGRPDMALFKFTRQILRGQKIEVYNYGKMKRDFTYIDDIVQGTVKAIQKNYAWEVINLSSGRSLDLSYVISLLEDALGKKAQKKFVALQKGDVLKTFGNISKAGKLLGYKPRYKIERGIKNFVDWYLRYYHAQ